MKLKRSILFLIFLGCVGCIVIVLILSPFLGGFHGMSYQKTKKFYGDNIKELSYVVNALMVSEYQEIELRHDNKDTVFCAVYNDISGSQYIENDISNLFDEKFQQSLNSLYKNGILTISKDTNICEISLWSSLDAGKGLLYSQDRTENIPGIVYTKEIAPNWLYYKECMDLWLERQK